MKKRNYSRLAVAMLLAPTILGVQPAFAEEMDTAVPSTEEVAPAAEEPAAAPTEETTEEEVVAEEAPAAEEAAETAPAADSTPEATSPEQPTVTTPNPTEIIPSPPVIDDVDGPVINTLLLKTVKKDSTFDPMNGVTAMDVTDGDLTSSITVSGTVNTAVVGDYSITYSVTNSLGKTTTATVQVSVIPDNVRTYSVSLPDFTVVRNADLLSEINKRISIKDYDGAAVNPDDVDIFITGVCYTGDLGTYTINVAVGKVVGSGYGYYSETISVNITVVEGLNVSTENKEIVLNSSFDPLDAITAIDTDSDGNQTVLGAYDVSTDSGISVIANNVDVTTPGVYTVSYSIKNKLGHVMLASASITVRESIVTINAEDVTIEQGQSFDPLAGVTAEDERDGDITSSITADDSSVDTAVVGDYPVTYTATNSVGVTETKTITVHVVKREATITASDQTVSVGTEVTEAMILGWATATDTVDTDLSIDYTVVNGPIDTSKAGAYTIEYSVTNSAGNTTTKTITLTIAGVTPAISVEDKVMYVGDKLTEEMVLEWATAENAESVGFEVVGEPIKIRISDNTLVEPGVHEIKFYAINGAEVAEATMTLTVKEREGNNIADNGNTDSTTNTDKKTSEKTAELKKAKKELPKTGEAENGYMVTFAGLIMMASVYFMKKRNEDEFNLY